MIRVFTERTKYTPDDELAFIGHPPLFLPPDQPVRISVVFTWEIPIAIQLKKSWSAHYDDVKMGGPAFGDQGGEFEPGLFIKKGYAITSRGCIRNCGFCFVPKREGMIRELEIKPGHIIQDNNLLACSDNHLLKVFQMLCEQKKAITFGGGLDARIFDLRHKNLFDLLTIKEMWFACDTRAAVKHLEKVGDLLADYPQYKKRCYVLLGWDKSESFEEAEQRLMKVYQLGFDPFAQLYQPENKIEYPQNWRDLSRTWERPAAFRTLMKNKEPRQ